MEITIPIIIVLIIICAYLALRLKKVSKSNTTAKEIKPIHPELNNPKKEEFKVIFPKVESRFYRTENANKATIKYLAEILKIEFKKSEKGESSIEESRWDISRRLFVVVGNTVLDMILKSPVLVEYLKNSIMRDGVTHDSFCLLSGHIDLKEGDILFSKYKRIGWSLSMSLDLNSKLNPEDSVALCLSSFTQYDKNGESSMGSIPLALTSLPYVVQGEIINVLLSLCQPETAIPILLGNEKFSFYHQQLRKRNPLWVDALLGKTDLQVVQVLES